MTEFSVATLWVSGAKEALGLSVGDLDAPAAAYH